MYFLEAFTVILALSSVSAAVDKTHPLSDENIALINQKATTWRAGRNFAIEDWERVKRISSGVLPDIQGRNTRLRADPHDEYQEVPESFDAREVWPSCDSIKQIWDQSNCKSDWAVSSVAAMSDRLCIHSDGKVQKYVSAEELLACCRGLGKCAMGCEAPGSYIAAWEYWQKSGIVTGGLHNSSQGCQDYSLEPCDHYSDTGKRPQCDSLVLEAPKCSDKCYNTSLDFEESKTYGRLTYIFKSEKQIQVEIQKNGPVTGSFYLYDDFLNYKSGIYKATTGHKYLGVHSVKILGWGVDNGTKYWLAANSWNEDWGEKGFFRILRGDNHCDIEDYAAASIPKSF